MDLNYLLPHSQIIFQQSLIIFAICFFLLLFITSNIFLAFGVVFLKALIFFIYYNYFPPDLSSRPDDIYYVLHSISFQNNFKWEHLNYQYLNSAMESFHFFYIIPSAISLYVLGDYYTSMAAGNIIVTCIVAICANSILKEQGYKWHQVFSLILLLFPDLLGFSTATAGKDTWVLLSHVVFIKAMSSYLVNKNSRFIFYLLLAAIISINLRFYIPVIFAFIILARLKITIYYILLVLILSFFILYFTEIYQNLNSLLNTGLANISSDLLPSLIAIPYGMLHFLLTPLPWQISLTHSYLLLPSIIYLMLLPMFILGLVNGALDQKNKFKRFMFFYILIFFIIYGYIDFLQGPRHRYQLDFGILYFIFIGFKSIKFAEKSS